MTERGKGPEDATATTAHGQDEDTPNLGHAATTPPQADVIADRQLKNAVKGQLFGSAQAPVKIDRFTVIKQLGAGGMGVVYSAYDDELERKVAIKLLHAGSSRPGSEGRARLLREAQAMAKLSHPNVISVYEVGTHEGAVFVAMEYVKGQTLREWLGRSRRRQEILDVLIQAGRGLAAAHAAGIVHRDFKPENVMVQASGRVRVLDFGLARPHDTAQPDAPPADDGSFVGRRGLLDSPLTQDGAIVGTPSYMAPEQHAGGETDARSDQFAFCVVLYEALYGQRPFQGSDFKALSLAVLRGKLAPEPTDANVPGWIREILLRGLAVEPEDRYDSIDDLIAALCDDPTVKVRRWAAAAAVGLAIVGAGAGGIVLGAGGSDPSGAVACAPAEEKLAGAWDEDREREVRGAFERSAASGADAAFAKLDERLDGYTHDWSAAYAASCELPPEADESSIELATQRQTCLDGRVRELGAFTSALVDIDDEHVPYVARVRLAPVDRCIDPASITAQAPPPANPDQLAEVMRTRIDIARALGLGMRDDDGAREAATRAVERARASGYRPVEAEALLAAVHSGWAVGTAPEGVALAEEAALVAEASGDLFTFVEAAFEVAQMQLITQAQVSEADQWTRRAEAAMARIGEDRELEGRRAYTHGTAMLVQHKAEQAIPLLQQALEIDEAVHGADAMVLVRTLNNLAVAQHNTGRLDDAKRNLDRHATIIERHLGRENQHLAYSLMNTASILAQQDKPEEALDYTERGLELIENNTPEDHPRRALALSIVADSLERLGRVDDALDHLERAERIVDRADFDAQAVGSLTKLAGLHHDQGRHRAALRASKKFIALLERQFSGNDLARDESYGSALALAAVDASIVGQHDQAVEWARRALDLAREQNADAEKLVLPRYALARALDGAGRSRDEVRELAAAALAKCPPSEEYGMKKPTPTKRRWYAEMKTWLEEHTVSAVAPERGSNGTTTETGP